MANENSKHMLTMKTEPEVINTEVKQHSCSLNSNDWKFSALVNTLYMLAEILNTELFNGVLSTPIITISNMRVTSLGSFTPGRNGFGAKNHITINSKHIHRNRLIIFATLLHEMLHQSEYEIHKKKPNRGNYHSAFFCSIALRLGIPTNSKGHFLGVLKFSAFTTVLLIHNLISQKELDEVTVAHIDEMDNDSNNNLNASPRSKLLKFSCACSNVRAAVPNSQALCLLCGEEFEFNDKAN